MGVDARRILFFLNNQLQVEVVLETVSVTPAVVPTLNVAFIQLIPPGIFCDKAKIGNRTLMEINDLIPSMMSLYFCFFWTCWKRKHRTKKTP